MTHMCRSTLLSIVSVLFVASAYADNYGPFPYELAFRMLAVNTPELSREVCKNQSSEIKTELESSLASTGLERLEYSDLCAGNFCGGKAVEDLNLDLTYELDWRKRSYARMSSEEQGVECNKFISIVKKLTGTQNSRPVKIFDRYINDGLGGS